MGNPMQERENALHARILRKESVAYKEAFELFMGPIISTVIRARRCSPEEARDAAIDVLMDYLEAPERFDPDRGNLLSYLTQSAKNTVTDWYRSTLRRVLREENFGVLFEIVGRSPKDSLEDAVEARRIVDRIEKSDLGVIDRAVLAHILLGERSTQRLGEVLGLSHLPTLDVQREVKRHRDRIIKWLQRFGREVVSVNS